MNTICAQCGYADPLHYVDQHKARASLQLHSHYTSRCPLTGGCIDCTDGSCGRHEKEVS